MNLDKIMAERFSCRKYSTYVPTREELTALLEAARIAPSACNRQPWHFTVVGADDADGRSAVAASYERDWVTTAPVYIIISGNSDNAWVRPFDSHNHVDVDAAIATEHICLKATELGLATCWICNFDPAALTSRMTFPEGFHPIVILPVGRPAEGTVIPAKTRKPLSETVTWR
ncbi:MAG: nitroreductase family protein [Muribaculaceae bacterium]|nr:nitroreductase family protein [Muribaculaceae bacterium]